VATFDINPDVYFTYGYGAEDGKQFIEGKFFSHSDNSSFGISLKVSRKTREEAVNTIHHLAKLIGNDVAK
jgi:hypothetical protein